MQLKLGCFEDQQRFCADSCRSAHRRLRNTDLHPTKKEDNCLCLTLVSFCNLVLLSCDASSISWYLDNNYTGQQQNLMLPENNHFSMLLVCWAQICSQIFAITSTNWDICILFYLFSCQFRSTLKISRNNDSHYWETIESFNLTVSFLWRSNWCTHLNKLV